MPRGRRNPLKTIVLPLASRFASDLAAAVEMQVRAQVREQVEGILNQVTGARSKGPAAAPGRRRAAGRRLPKACRVPGCKNPNKGPRYDFFCEKHRDLPAAEKEKIKAAARAGKGPARKGRRRGRRA
jgi:hypothetical protein